MNPETMSEHIRKARLALQNASYSEYFSEMNKLQLPPKDMVNNKLPILQIIENWVFLNK